MCPSPQRTSTKVEALRSKQFLPPVSPCRGFLEALGTLAKLYRLAEGYWMRFQLSPVPVGRSMICFGPHAVQTLHPNNRRQRLLPLFATQHLPAENIEQGDNALTTKARSRSWSPTSLMTFSSIAWGSTSGGCKPTLRRPGMAICESGSGARCFSKLRLGESELKVTCTDPRMVRSELCWTRCCQACRLFFTAALVCDLRL